MVAGTVKGTCWTSSIAVSSSNAYRCMTDESLLYDPCFAPEARTFTQLACMASPWGEVTRFELTAPIPKSALHPNGKPWVWAEQLGNGVRCITDTGTGVEVDRVALELLLRTGKGLGEHSRREDRALDGPVREELSVQGPRDRDGHDRLVLIPGMARLEVPGPDLRGFTCHLGRRRDVKRLHRLNSGTWRCRLSCWTHRGRTL